MLQGKSEQYIVISLISPYLVSALRPVVQGSIARMSVAFASISRSELRTLLKYVLVDDTEFQRLCSDHFPKILRSLGSGMQFEQMLTVFLQRVEGSDVIPVLEQDGQWAERLRQYRQPARVRRAADQSGARNSAKYLLVPTLILLGSLILLFGTWRLWFPRSRMPIHPAAPEVQPVWSAAPALPTDVAASSPEQKLAKDSRTRSAHGVRVTSKHAQSTTVKLEGANQGTIIQIPISGSNNSVNFAVPSSSPKGSTSPSKSDSTSAPHSGSQHSGSPPSSSSNPIRPLYPTESDSNAMASALSRCSGNLLQNGNFAQDWPAGWTRRFGDLARMSGNIIETTHASDGNLLHMKHDGLSGVSLNQQVRIPVGQLFLETEASFHVWEGMMIGFSGTGLASISIALLDNAQQSVGTIFIGTYVRNPFENTGLSGVPQGPQNSGSSLFIKIPSEVTHNQRYDLTKLIRDRLPLVDTKRIAFADVKISLGATDARAGAEAWVRKLVLEVCG